MQTGAAISQAIIKAYSFTCHFIIITLGCCAKEVQNGCVEEHLSNGEKNCCNSAPKPRRKLGSADRSSSDEICFDLELDKEDEKPANDTKPSEVKQDEKPAEKPEESNQETKSRKHPRFAHQNSWKHALKKAMTMPDPWEMFHLDMCSQENAIRHRYNALKKTWVQDKVRIKMESTVSSSPFV